MVDDFIKAGLSNGSVGLAGGDIVSFAKAIGFGTERGTQVGFGGDGDDVFFLKFGVELSGVKVIKDGFLVDFELVDKVVDVSLQALE